MNALPNVGNSAFHTRIHSTQGTACCSSRVVIILACVPTALAQVVDSVFHGIAYQLTVSTLGSETLCLEVEQKSDCSRWRGDFTSRYIEDITAKTGNFKK